MEKRKNINRVRKRETDSQVVFGRRAVEEVFESSRKFEKLYIQKDLKGDFVSDLKRKARNENVSTSLVPVERLNRITRKNHQGVIGFLSLIEYSSLHHIIADCYERGVDPFVVILDQITDVRNIGSIARSAECAGVDAIVLPTKGSGQINSDAMKTSAGALNHIAVCRESNLYEICRYLQSSGLQLAACSEKGNKQYFNIDLDQPTAIILGSEDEGISKALLKIADQHVQIPMKGKIKSLNVSNAASVILFEVVRQRFG